MYTQIRREEENEIQTLKEIAVKHFFSLFYGKSCQRMLEDFYSNKTKQKDYSRNLKTVFVCVMSCQVSRLCGGRGVDMRVR